MTTEARATPPCSASPHRHGLAASRAKRVVACSRRPQPTRAGNESAEPPARTYRAGLTSGKTSRLGSVQRRRVGDASHETSNSLHRSLDAARATPPLAQRTTCSFAASRASEPPSARFRSPRTRIIRIRTPRGPLPHDQWESGPRGDRSRSVGCHHEPLDSRVAAGGSEQLVECSGRARREVRRERRATRLAL